MINYNKLAVVSIHSAVVSRVCVRPTSKKWVLKIVQVTMKHDPFDAIRNPCRYHSFGQF